VYRKPGLGSRILACFLNFPPKLVAPFSSEALTTGFYLPTREVVVLHPEGECPMGRNSGNKSLDLSQFAVLTFDCYGTLIDWETGLLGALRPLLRSKGQYLEDRQILDLFSELEPRAQNPYQRYHRVLADVARGFGERLGFPVSAAQAESLPESLKHWQPFPDTRAALEKLKSKHKLAIISNTDDDFFAASAQHLQVKFDEVITAEQAKAYKPSLAPFHLALERLGFPPERVLHVGQSVYHDVLPAKSLGIATVLVRRRGFGATPRIEGEPDLKVPDLQTLASLA
jgi:2-haloacid dehalogenase